MGDFLMFDIACIVRIMLLLLISRCLIQSSERHCQGARLDPRMQSLELQAQQVRCYFYMTNIATLQSVLNNK